MAVSPSRRSDFRDILRQLNMGLEDRFEQPIGSLSGGQRQLIGLARAVYKSPSILVLDEPNAHLDEHGETHLLNALQAFKNQGKTVVVISHRTNILKVTDQLLVMKNGEVLHHGPTDIVIKQLNNEKSTQQAA